MNDTLFIPTKLKVGYKTRQDTYTNKLAYVIYYDQKNKLRKQTSWENWRDKTIDTDDFENVPTSGFVLNKNVGGVKSGYHSWDTRMEKVRVYDPRGFEFEIGIPNMLFLLQECTSTKGKGLEGEFVYAWSGPELILLPIDSQEYRDSNAFTTLQHQKIGKSEMVPGKTYTFKDKDEAIYLGRYDYYTGQYFEVDNPKSKYRYDRKTRVYHYYDCKPMHIFVYANGEYRVESGFTKVGSIADNTIVGNYAELLETYLNSEYGSQIVDIKYKTKDNVLVLEYENTWTNYIYFNVLYDGVVLKICYSLPYKYKANKKEIIPNAFKIYNITGTKYVIEDGIYKEYQLNGYEHPNSVVDPTILKFRKEFNCEFEKPYNGYSYNRPSEKYLTTEEMQKMIDLKAPIPYKVFKSGLELEIKQ